MKPCPLQTKSAGSRCGVTRQVVRLSERVAHERAQHVHAVNTPQDRRTGRAGEGARTTINLPAQGSGKSAPPPKVRALQAKRMERPAANGPRQQGRRSNLPSSTARLRFSITPRTPAWPTTDAHASHDPKPRSRSDCGHGGEARRPFPLAGRGLALDRRPRWRGRR
jgi:hypothetical protein